MNKPKLTILIGISASGKSTYAKQLVDKENCIIVSSDGIRQEICEGGVPDQSKNEEVFQLFHKRIRENLKDGKDVIADATSITLKSRRAIFNAVRGIDCNITGIIIVKSIEECLKDNKDSNREYPVPEEVIHRQVRKFQIPFKEEGFDTIEIYTTMKPNYSKDVVTYRMLEEMKNFDQKNPHHSQTLDEHCEYVHRLFTTKYNYPFKYRLGARFHDCGKLYTQTFDENGVAHYLGHENIGTYLLLQESHSLIINRQILANEILDTLFLVNYHMFPMNWNTDKAKEKWKKIFGDYKYQLLVDFNKCDKARPDN